MQGTGGGELPAQRNSVILYPSDVLIDDTADLVTRDFRRLLAPGMQRIGGDIGLHRLPRIPADEIHDAWLLVYSGLQERLEEPVQAGRLEIPVGNQHFLAVGRQDP